MRKTINPIVQSIKPSGIRKFFDLANTMDNVISLGVGEPDFDTPWHICENAVYSMNIGHTHYTANKGLLELRQEIAKFHATHYDQHYDPETEILVTVGGSEAIDLAMRSILEPGDEVILMDPNYVAYEPSVLLAQAKPTFIQLKEEDDFKLTYHALKQAITPKTKAIMLNFPSNPTGGIMTCDDYAKLIDLIKESGIYCISDEIYAELLFDGKFSSLSQFVQIKDQVIVINGFSKAFAMTGFRLGYALGPKDVIDAMTKIHQYMIMSAPTQAQYAGIEAMKHGYDDVCFMREQYKQRRNLLVNRLNRMGLKTNLPHGTFYVFANIRKTGLSSEAFCERLLQSKRVACVPGNAFGTSGEGYIRISYATDMDSIIMACDRLEEFLKEL